MGRRLSFLACAAWATGDLGAPLGPVPGPNPNVTHVGPQRLERTGWEQELWGFERHDVECWTREEGAYGTYRATAIAPVAKNSNTEAIIAVRAERACTRSSSAVSSAVGGPPR